MALTPVPCACGGGGGGGGTGEACCAPSITSTPLCRPDCSTIIVVVQSGCADCGAAPTAPEVVGWVDPATGMFTAGPAPADAQPCDGCGCVDTICVTRCDDTTGDGTADTTYSELWCVHPDGSTALILTYQNDPSTPYTPVSPVDCTMACPESETVMLCDDSGPFLRRYVFLNGQASYEDVALDGQTPHVVAGTVRACSGEECEQPTTPVATIGLCLADGTPIAVIVTRGCEGVVTRQGWLDLTTGSYSAGDPPAGTMSCGDSQSIQTSGVFCDVDPATGDVHGLVLVEYTYAADGSIASVRLIDATTGQTYTPQGDITTCPTGTPQPEQDLVILCDVAADGTVTRFVRDFRRDENGTISGHSDYTLDGAAYTPTGTVGLCVEPCRETATQLLCDDITTTVALTVTQSTLAAAQAVRPAQADLAGPEQALFDGGSLVFPAETNGAAGDGNQVYRAAVGQIAATVTGCPQASGTLTVSVRVTENGPDPGLAFTGAFRLHKDGQVLDVRETPFNAAVGGVTTISLSTPVTAADLTSGSIYAVLVLETYHLGTSKSWTADQFTVTADLDDCTTQFFRTLVTDCETGTVLSHLDTTLDGAAYTPQGTVGTCQPDECPVQQVIQADRCDDTTGDGLPDTSFVELLGIDCLGVVRSIGNYNCTLEAPYTPVSPVDCWPDVEPVPPVLSGVQARRVQLAPGQSWNGLLYGTLRTVTATAHNGTGTVTTTDGTSTLFEGETATWSISKDPDVRLVGPLTITAATGTITVTFTTGVDL
ncbi:hypothetical protein ABTX60_07240 [Streptomyces sp. NPDC126510]|uniref:hypothetical protein n=1 Tax=Streptomyces sp. NPDC126510 TaxID=3155317 RepID=UPI00331C3D40